MSSEPIAIIGIGCRFPQSPNPEAFWQLMRDGKDAITEVPKSRWDVDTYYHQDPKEPNRTNTRWGGFLDQIDHFDPQFFGIAPREVTTIDPQQRLILEVAWESLEDAGIIPEQLAGTKTGVFIGIGSHEYSTMVWHKPLNDPYSTTGTANCLAANRISYVFDFKGPSLAVDTACSSSLVAVHLACQSLKTGESTLAIAGGVNIIMLPGGVVGFTKGGFLSAEGRCKSFDADANGYVRSEGAGAVVLKPLKGALADGDTIYALIRGTACNQDGRTEGLAAPNLQSQIEVLREAYENAGISPEKVQYIEAHGTGTKIGDRIELEALGTVLAQNRSINDVCAIGSVKTNIGHTETAAGIAGIIKVALALKNRQIPPNLHFNKPNPAVDFTKLSLRVQETLTPWNNSKTLIAGVNSFGFGGTNAHIVLEEAPLTQTISPKTLERPIHLLTLSAKTEPALRELVNHYRIYLEQHPVTSIADICFTANTRRSQFNHRLSVMGSREQLQESLEKFVLGAETTNIRYSQVTEAKSAHHPIVFLFTGQGSQYLNMGRQLYETQPLFRQTLDRCAEILHPYLNIPLLDILYPKDDTNLLDQTIYTQPALFALEYTLATLWMSWGVMPSVVLGHSVGEYVAACLAGVFSLEDGLKLIAARGRLMQSLPGDGMMLAVLASEKTVRDAIKFYSEDVSIAAFNGSENFVISGRREAIETIRTDLTALSVKTTPLKVSHGFHSPLMEPILNDFAQVAREVTYHRPRLSLISNLTGDFITDDIATPEYWCLHLRQAVKFAQSIATLQKHHYDILLEIGAQPTLLGMVRTDLGSSSLLLPSLRSGTSDLQQLLNSLSELYLKGYKIDWFGFDQDYSRRLVTLPSYPFQRQRYWAQNAEDFITTFAKYIQQSSFKIHPLLGQKLSLANSSSIVFQSQISQISSIYLQDHCLENTPVFPAAAYIEMALVAGANIFPSKTVQLKNISIEQPLTLPERITKTIQLILTPINQEYQFEIFSVDEENISTRHASGEVLSIEKNTNLATVNVNQIKNDCTHNLSIDEHYQRCQEQGLNYGLYFQGLQQIWCNKDQALGLIQLPPQLQEEATSYQIHPTLLDASFQVLGAIIEQKTELIYLPVGLESLQVYRPLTNKIWSFVQIEQNSKEIKANLQLLDESGNILAEIKGFSLKAINRQSLERVFQNSLIKKDDLDLSKALYEIAWQPKSKSNQTKKLVGNWLIFAGQDIGHKLANLLQKQGNHCILVIYGETYTCLDEQHYTINPAHSEDFRHLFNQIQLPDLKIVHLWGLDEQINLEEAQIIGCRSVLHLIQALPHSQSTYLSLITRNTQPVTTQTQLQIQQSPLWGLARVIRLEYPNLSCISLDLDSTEEELQILQNELLYSDNEEQIAYREGVRYVPRLVQQTLKTQSNESVQLKLSQTGSLDNLTLAPLVRRTPAPDEVEIAVCTAGVNFRDVLNALGMLQPYLEQMGYKDASDIPFGGECAGKIVAVGGSVKGLQVGDEVIAAFALGSLASFVTVKSSFVVPKPKTMTFAEAATIPSTFLTAYYGLHYLAKIKAGDRILIHAAAGGVGQAAVQIAQRIGAEVFATASLPKWDFLREMGIQHIMNSRTLDFTEEIMTLTDNKGVDLVLNSLNGDFIPQSLQVLAKGGKFVEIGKIGVWDEKQVRQFRDDVSYYLFDLLEIARDNPNLIATLLGELMQDFQNSSLKPLPHKVFEIKESVNAFRYIAGAKHIGKVIISLPEPTSPTLIIRSDQTYLITGGLGALGLQVAQWLVEKGAKHLILVSRSDSSPTAQETIQQLKKDGVEITVVKGDISQIKDVNRIIVRKKRGKKQPPLAGIIHAAGVLDDGMLSNLTWERFNKVMGAKVQGAWNLHMATQELPLDFFVCFSSIVSLIGSPGQGSYASANFFMDTLAHYRRSLGLPGLSINWGPWSDAGMAVSLEQNLLASKGITSISPEFGLQVLETLLNQNITQSGVFLVDWSKFLNKLPSQKEFSFFEAVKPVVTQIPEKTTKHTSEFLQQFEATPKNEQESLLSEHIRHQLARVLGFSQAEQIDPIQNFSDLGMDSLMAVEFKNNLQVSLDLSLSNNIAVDYPTVELLTNYLLQEIRLDETVEKLVPKSLDTNGHKPAIITTPVPSEIKEIPAQFYQFELSSEYIGLKTDINRANQLGNPFFMVRDGVAKDTTTINGRELIHYSSYNYIGMSGDYRVSDAAKEAINRYGTSVSASRVLSGEIALHQELEKEIADFLGTEDCIVYIGGHTTNVTTIGHLFKRNDLILYDALSHNSIRQGCQMSGATLMEFPHNDWQSLEQLLSQQRHLYEKVLIVIEGIYSTDGDIAPLPQIIELKKRYKTFLMVDEAHSIGVLGATGRGIGEYFGISAKDVDLWMGTLSKSFASCGGYIAASEAIIEYLKYSAPGFVFSVGMTPANTASALAALQLLKAEPERVKLLSDRSKLFLSLAQEFGFNTGISKNTPIIPIIIGEPDASVELCKTLFKQGINVQPMVYPSVPYNEARLRFFITSSHTEEQIKFTLKTLAEAIILLPK